MICIDDGCDKPVKVAARGLCNAHYIRAQRAGSLPPLDRFAANVERGPDCWQWKGRKEKGGYGRWGGSLAHRVAWERKNGPIPDALTVDHLCKNPGCVNVAHMRLLPLSENASDNKWRDRTECINRHPWDAANTRVRIRKGKPQRVCRACERERQARCAARRKAS